jgi:hypothetical protein
MKKIIVLGMIFALTGAAGCELAQRPTLEETRSGRAATLPPERDLRAGEILAEVDRIDPQRREIRLREESGRALVLSYDQATRVIYQGREYGVENLEAGDVVALRVPPRSDNYVASMRVYETVQDRLAKGTSRPPLARFETVEGTVENVNRERGVFDLRLRSGKVVTVTLPYNARSADVDDLRRLRRGDFVRLEGGFVNPETFQMQAFLEAPFRASR